MLIVPIALRLYPIVEGTSRVALQDVVLPEGGGADGKSPVLVSKGTLVILAFHALHKRQDLWGPDAEEFRPERWEVEKASWVRLSVPLSLRSLPLVLMYQNRNSCLSVEAPVIV